MGSYSNGSAINPSTTVTTGITLPSGAYPTAIQFIPASAITVSGRRTATMSSEGIIMLSVAPTSSSTNYSARTGKLATVSRGAANTNWSSSISAGTYNFTNVNPGSPFIGNTAYAGCTIYIVIQRIGTGFNGGTFSIPAGKLVVTTTSKYTGVTAGNVIKATDRSQTGTTTTANTVMTDSHFSAGTKIEASTFNTQVLNF